MDVRRCYGTGIFRYTLFALSYWMRRFACQNFYIALIQVIYVFNSHTYICTNIYSSDNSQTKPKPKPKPADEYTRYITVL